MKTTCIKMIAMGGLVALQAACVFGGDEPDPEPWTPTDPTLPAATAVIDADYISGHLGNYADCPEKGYREGAMASADEPSADFAPGAGACAPSEDGEDNCGSFRSCNEAQLTLKLSNDSASETATQVGVKSIELLDDDGMVRAVLPVRDVVLVMGQMTFGGVLMPGESANVRVDYKGPVNLQEILADESSEDGAPADGDIAGDEPARGNGYYYGAKLRITIEAENAVDVIVNTKSVQSTPDVAT